ncbi:hypothetical protein GCM10027170_16810 [Aliiglaciecola aliphaticivorans]
MKFIVLAVVIALAVFYFNRNSNNKKLAVENTATGKAFLTQNKANEDVVETATGLQYQVMQKGDG